MIYQAEITLQAPLTVTVRRATGNDVETLDYISGTAWRGALAAAYLASGGADEKFRALFLENWVRFGSLRLDGADVWPLSAQWCKEWRDEHPFRDRLLGAAAGREEKVECGWGEGSSAENRCDAKLEQPEGFVRWEKPKGEPAARYVTKKVAIRRTAHAAIHPLLLKTRAGQLFSMRGLEAGQVFKGRVSAEGPAIDVLSELVPVKGLPLRVGRARSRGQGAVHLQLTKLAAGPGDFERNSVRRRIEAVQKRVAEIGGRLANMAAVTVTLQTPAIVWDEFLLTPEFLEPEHVNLTGGWKLAGWFSKRVVITGWHAAPEANVPRSEVTAIQAGSCFAFIKEGPADLAGLVEWAVNLEHSGIGERRDEGFGEASVCLEYHARQAEGHHDA